MWKPEMLVPIILLTVYFLVEISQLILIVYLSILFFINIVCPFIFQRLHNHKSIIEGPWDEALIESDDDGKKKKKL
jgi:hypothetical protein